MRMRTAVPAIALAATVALGAVAPGFAAETGGAGTGNSRQGEKVANIRKLVHIMSGKQMKDMMDTMFESSRRAIEARMPPDAKEDLEARKVVHEFMKSASLGEKDLEEMMDLMIPFYDKFLDEADVGALVQFYESPAGKKFVQVMPRMMAEMMPQLMGWMMDKLKGPTEELQRKLKEIQEKKAKEMPAAGPPG
ncbi:MAG: DUF2059 domain-containing protein [Deltaproteobacteria bacterium]